MGERRESKKRETRERISDAATTLFVARGFEAVTLDEIAFAAGVSKMTIFNYFGRKEDLMLDRDDELRLVPFREALRDRPKDEAPVDTLRRVVDRMRVQTHPFFAPNEAQTVSWWRVVAASPSLKARLREVADEAAEGLAIALAGPDPDGVAQLIAGTFVLSVYTGLKDAVRVLEHGGSTKKATAALLALMDRGLDAIAGMSARSR